MQAAIADATGKDRPLRIAINCAGIGWAQRTVGRDGDAARPRRVHDDGHGQPGRHLQRAAAGRGRDGDDRAGRGRRARRHRQHRLDRRLRRADRADRLRGVQGRHRRHDPPGGAGPLQRRRAGVHDRPRAGRHAAARQPARGGAAGAVGGHTLSQAARPARRLRRAGARRSSSTATSTARSSAWTARCAWRLADQRTRTHHPGERPEHRHAVGDAVGARVRSGRRTGRWTCSGRCGPHRRGTGDPTMRVGRRRPLADHDDRRRPGDRAHRPCRAATVADLGLGAGGRAGRDGGARVAGRRRPARRLRPRPATRVVAELHRTARVAAAGPHRPHVGRARPRRPRAEGDDRRGPPGLARAAPPGR